MYVNPDQVISVVTGVVTVASVITTVTPTPKPNTFWGKLYKVIEVCALVFGKAKDKDKVIN